MNVNCDYNKNICEAAITIIFPAKQTIMKHDMNKFNLTQFECRIQNLINLQINLPVNRKSWMCFSCFSHSKYHTSIMPPLQCDFLMMCAFSYGWLFWVAIFYHLTFEKNEVYTGNLTHFRQTLLLINPITAMSDQGRISPYNINTISIR